MIQLSSTTARSENPIGTVRIKVKLTNFVDEELVQRGLLNPNEALIDTGAARTVLPGAIAQQLGLRLRSQQTVQFASGTQALVGLSEPVAVELKGRETIETAIVAGNTAFIGNTVFATLDLQIDDQNQRLIPNPEHPNYSILRI
jgi:predicted aspartyl protease